MTAFLFTCLLEDLIAAKKNVILMSFVF